MSRRPRGLPVLVLALILAVSGPSVAHDNARQPPLLVVGDASGAVPPALAAALAPWPHDTRTAGVIPVEQLAAYRAVIWAAGANPQPLWPQAARVELDGYLARGGSLLVTGDHAGEALSANGVGLVPKYARARFRDRVGARWVDGGDDPFAWGLHFALDGWGADAFSISGTTRVMLVAADADRAPIALRREGADWPAYRFSIAGLDLSRVPAGTLQPLLKRLMGWLIYPPREDFVRVIAFAERRAAGPARRAIEERARVALATDPRAPEDYRSALSTASPEGRKALARVARLARDGHH